MPQKIFFLTSFFLIIFLSTFATSLGWTAEVASKITELEKKVLVMKAENKQVENQLNEANISLQTKINELEKNVVSIKNDSKTSKSVYQSAKIAADNADLVIKFTGVVFSVLGILGSLAALFGIREFKKVGQTRIQAERALQNTILLARAAQSLIQADVMSDGEDTKDLKRLRVLVALSMIEDLLRRGHDDPAIYNWHAYALKRIGHIETALEAVENVFTKGKAKEGSYEYRRGLYNKACYLTLLAKTDKDVEKAYQALQRAITGDYHLGQVALIDTDLKNLDRQRLESIVTSFT